MDSANWNVDGQAADFNYKEVLFTTPAIDRFLATNHQFIIVASKGMGKTLLIRHKRDIVQKDPSIIAIPKDSQSDYVNLFGAYEAGITNRMEEQDFWEHLWKLAIQSSVLLNFPHKITADEKASVIAALNSIDLPKELRDSLVAAFEGEYRTYSPPSSILEMLLNMSLSKLEKLKKSAPHRLYELTTRYVTSACYVFIDNVDRSIEQCRPGSLEAWAAAQCGLLRAAWDISRNNHHIRVYATVRQEAYASFDGTDANNIQGSILLLKYSKQDLHSLFAKAIQHYEGVQSVEEFVGLPKIYNEWIKRYEDPFDYIYRHLIAVPRWFAILGQRLSELRNSGKIAGRNEYNARLEAVREEVNTASAQLADVYICNEMNMFFRGLDPKEMIRQLFLHMHSTVLSMARMEYVAGVMEKEYHWRHPFSLLYNMGLVGLVREKPGGINHYQKFNKPYEFDWGINNVLPIDKDGIYVVHPAVHSLMKRHNPQCRYSGVLIGDGLPWPKKNNSIVRNEALKLFVSYSHLDDDVVKEILQVLRGRLEAAANSYIWIDYLRMEVGRSIHTQIGEAIKDCDFLILMVSPNSLKSDYVMLEWHEKFFSSRSKDRVMPIYIEAASYSDAPAFLKQVQGLTYRSPADAPLIRDLADQMVRIHRKAA